MPNTAETPRFTEVDPILAQCLALPAHEWPENLMSVLIARIENAFQDERSTSMTALHNQLERLLTHVLKEAPDEVRTSVLSNQGNPAIRIAYVLGRLSFAQELAATVALHRPDDAFFEVFKDPLLVKILTHLKDSPSFKADIARVRGIPTTVLDLKMKELRAKGLVDFRMGSGPDGAASSAEYFLTPAAESIMATQAAA